MAGEVGNPTPWHRVVGKAEQLLFSFMVDALNPCSARE